MRIIPKRAIFLLITLALLTAVLSSYNTNWSGPEKYPTSSDKVIVTGNADGAPDGCTIEKVAERLIELTNAVNNADPAVVSKFFKTDNSYFQWYCTVEDGDHFTAYTKEELEAHFQRRYKQNEKWQLLRVVVNGWDQSRGLLHFGPVVIKQTADDQLSPFESMGKGAYSCRQENFVVLCLGAESTY